MFHKHNFIILVHILLKNIINFHLKTVIFFIRENCNILHRHVSIIML